MWPRGPPRIGIQIARLATEGRYLGTPSISKAPLHGIQTQILCASLWPSKVMYKQVVSRRFKQSVSVVGALVVVVALVRCIQGQTAGTLLPLLSFTPIAVIINLRCALPVPRERWWLAPNESLLLLAALLFDGEAAVVLAAATTLCLALRASKHWLNLSYSAAVTVISTGLIVLIVRLSSGSLGDRQS